MFKIAGIFLVGVVLSDAILAVFMWLIGSIVRLVAG